MRKKENWKRVISKITLFVSAVFLLVMTFHSCQQDDFFEQTESNAFALKNASIETVVYPDIFAGPITFSPVQGKMIAQTATLENTDYDDFETAFALVVQNGDANELNKVTGANIYVNGVQLMTIADFKKAPAVMYRKINDLGASTNIAVEVKGKTTGILTVWMEGTLKEVPLETFTDERDGKVYKTITIGNQTWMAENLAYKTESGSSVYNNDENNVATYGRLYTWNAAMTASPAGWHLPSNAEWAELVQYLTDNGYGYEGSGDDVAKALASTIGWVEEEYPGTPCYEPEKNNSSGFNGFPNGYRNLYGSFEFLGYCVYWWSSDQSDTYSAFCRNLWYYNSRFSQDELAKNFSFSVRCIKDAE
jgi:uncharacterized protein (TIGR02145 family)